MGHGGGLESEKATLFVANALGGEVGVNNGPPVVTTSTVVRFRLSLSVGRPPALVSATIVGSGFPWIANQAALVLGPTGLALGRTGTLYVDDTQRNTISAVANATTRTNAVVYGSSVISTGGALNAPLGMTRAPTVTSSCSTATMETPSRSRRQAPRSPPEH